MNQFTVTRRLCAVSHSIISHNICHAQTIVTEHRPSSFSLGCPVHFNIAPNGKLFAGDGGGPSSVAAPGNGQWIYLFTPTNGKLKTEKLVNLAKHDYKLEPNVTFTPDMKWIVFRSNMHGPTHVYAVEVKGK